MNETSMVSAPYFFPEAVDPVPGIEQSQSSSGELFNIAFFFFCAVIFLFALVSLYETCIGRKRRLKKRRAKEEALEDLKRLIESLYAPNCVIFVSWRDRYSQTKKSILRQMGWTEVFMVELTTAHLDMFIREEQKGKSYEECRDGFLRSGEDSYYSNSTDEILDSIPPFSILDDEYPVEAGEEDK